MAKFKFRLATLVRLRESVRDERRGELAQAFRAEELLEEKKAILEDHLSQLRHQARESAGPGEIDIDRLMEARRFETVLLAEREHVGQQQQMVRGEIERRREALVAANRDVQVLENLRGIQLERHRAEANRMEIRQLDEVAGVRANREDRT